MQVRKLSLRRPPPLGTVAPMGQDARDLFFDAAVGHPGHGCTPATVVQTFLQAEQGDPTLQCDLFDDLVEADCHLRSLFEKRNEAVSGKPYVIQSGGQGDEAAQAARVMRWALGKLPMTDVIQHLLTYNLYGFACVEIDWDLRFFEGRLWIVPVWFTAVQQRRFRILNSTNFFQSPGVTPGVNELRLYADPTRPLGDPLRPGKWLVNIRSGATIARAGLGRTVAWPALGKRYGWRDWVIFSDKFGKPLPLASYEEDADDEAKNVAEQIIKSIGDDYGAIKPKTIDVDFKEVKNIDNSKTHGGLISHANSEMSKAVNGSTLATDNSGGSGTGSYAQANVHDSVRWEAVQYDANRVEMIFDTQLAAPFCAYNNVSIDAPPRTRVQVVRDLDPKTRIDVVARYKNELGGKVSAQQMQQELGIREPTDDGDDLPGMPEPALAPAPPAKEAA